MRTDWTDPQKLDQKSNNWEVGFFMAKYSYEFKLKNVQEYLSGKGSYEYLSEKHNIPASIRLKEWVATYKEYGKEALMRSRQNKNYSF